MKLLLIALILSFSVPAGAHSPGIRDLPDWPETMPRLTPTHAGRWHHDHVEWRSTLFEQYRPDWRFEFATPLPKDAEISLAREDAWDGQARVELVRDEDGAIIGVQHHGIATQGELLTRVPRDAPEPPLIRDTVQRLLLDGARVVRPQLPLQAHLRHIRHQKVTDEDIQRFGSTTELAVYVLPDADYLASGGLQASIQPDGELSDERVKVLGVALTVLVTILLVIGSQLARRARQEQLTMG